jgi:hypothetical protein
MELRFENDGDSLAMYRDDEVICRVRTDETDLGFTESLPEFVARHGDIDRTLLYMRQVNLQKNDQRWKRRAVG